MLMSELQRTRHVAQLYLSLDIYSLSATDRYKKVGGLILIYPQKSKPLFLKDNQNISQPL